MLSQAVSLSDEMETIALKKANLSNEYREKITKKIKING